MHAGGSSNRDSEFHSLCLFVTPHSAKLNYVYNLHLSGTQKYTEQNYINTQKHTLRILLKKNGIKDKKRVYII